MIDQSLPQPRTQKIPKTTRKQRGLKPAHCARCREISPRRELVELHEDNHDNLAYFHGDLLCRPCADRAGVSY